MAQCRSAGDSGADVHGRGRSFRRGRPFAGRRLVHRHPSAGHRLRVSRQPDRSRRPGPAPFRRSEPLGGTIALVFRTGQIPLFGGLSVKLAFGEGLSYGSERPRLEGSFRVEPSRSLNDLAFEAESSPGSLPGVYFLPRIHHRSGIFGLVAERESGSNVIGAGIRMDLRWARAPGPDPDRRAPTKRPPRSLATASLCP